VLIFFSNLLEEILDYRNVQQAMKQLINNHGTGGIANEAVAKPLINWS